MGSTKNSSGVAWILERMKDLNFKEDLLPQLEAMVAAFNAEARVLLTDPPVDPNSMDAYILIVEGGGMLKSVQRSVAPLDVHPSVDKDMILEMKRLGESPVYMERRQEGRETAWVVVTIRK